MSENIATWLGGGVVSALVAYFTTVSTIQSRLANVEARIETIELLQRESRQDIKDLLKRV